MGQVIKEGERRIGSLEIGRGVAASLVVFHHAGNIAEQPRFYGEAAFGGHLAYFYVGVDFFFVLSGFIIAWVHWNDIGLPSKIGRYAVKRFLRIYPPYWGILIPLVLLYAAFPASGIPSQRDPVNIAMSVLLLPYPEPPVLGVAWTLVHEIFFYAIFALVIAIGRKALWIMPLWAAGIVAASFAGPIPHLAAFVFSPFNLEFIFGVGAAVLLRHHDVPFPKALAAFGAAAFLSVMLFFPVLQLVPLHGRIVFGIAASLFVVGMVEIEWSRPIALPTWLAFFGAASYAVYLIHPVILSFAMQGVTRILGTGPSVEAMVVAISLAAIGAGFLYHWLPERLLTNFARSALRRIGLDPRRPARPVS